jgi:hypothetical protein
VKSPLDQQVDFVRQLIAKTPDISLLDIKDALEQRGVKRSPTAIWNCLERHDIEPGGRRKRRTQRKLVHVGSTAHSLV